MYKKIILYFILIFSIYLFGYKLGYTNYEFTSTLKIDSSYKIKLDNFLRTTYDSKSNFSSDKNYLLFLDKINFKINSYKNKYSSKEDFKLLLNYLSEGILNIKILVEKDNELDDFFCEITGNCNTSSSSSSSTSGGGITNKLELSYHDTVTKTQKSSYYKDEILDFYAKGFGNTPNSIRACMENVSIPSTSCSISSNLVSPPSDWSYIGDNTWKNSGFKLSNVPAGTYKGYWKDLNTGETSNIIEVTIINQNKPISSSSSSSSSSSGGSCNINYGKTCELSSRYFYHEKGNYDKYITGDEKRAMLRLDSSACPAVPPGEVFSFAQYTTDAHYLFEQASKLSPGDGGYWIKSEYLTCASQTLGKIDCSGKCVSSLGPNTSSSSSSSSSGGGVTTKLEFSYHDTVTKSQKSSYYRDEILDFYANGIGNTPDTIRACMENIGIPSTSCSISTNWVKPPNDWSYIGNNTWKNSGFKLSNIPVGTYRGYWKDISNNRESNIIELTIINQNKPEFLKTPNISYYGSKKLDLYYPTNVYNSNKVPVYLMLHGGAWYSGDKGDVDSSIVDFGKYFTKNGVAYVPMSYTLATSSKSSYDLVYKEISCALNWINFNKDKYNFDTNDINLLGWSAGGHLVLQYSLNQNFYTTNDCSWGNNIINLSQIVSVAGPSDLTKDFSNTEAGNLNPYLEYFLGSKKGTDLFNQRVYSNSPINFVNKDNKNKKYYIFHAKNDGIVNYQEHAVPFYNLLKNNNYNVILDTGFDNHNALSIPEVSIKKVLNQ